jgi:hypothetical protein
METLLCTGLVRKLFQSFRVSLDQALHVCLVFLDVCVSGLYYYNIIVMTTVRDLLEGFVRNYMTLCKFQIQ